HLESEVPEDPTEPAGDLAELVPAAQLPEREVDGSVEARQRGAIEVVGAERLHQGADPAGALRHPGRGRARRRRRELDPRLRVDLLADGSLLWVPIARARVRRSGRWTGSFRSRSWP